MNILKLTWNDYQTHVSEVSRQINLSGKKYNYITGIPRGGLIPAIMISHILNIPFIENSKLWTIDYRQSLLIDDISDSGKTLKKYSEVIDKASIVCRISLLERPKYYSLIVPENQWVMFPYESSVEDSISNVNYKDRVKQYA